jgi:rRNA maturation endonuclease Nob1
MTGFICINCKYKFKAEKADICPYCSKKTIEREKSASEIVDEVESMLAE